MATIVAKYQPSCTMNEPHQRSQSGKLRSTKSSTGNSSIAKDSDKPEQRPGINNTTKFEYDSELSTLQSYLQTPGSLTNTHIYILSKIAKGFNIKEDSCIDIEWRKTWNLGRWSVSDKIYISCNIIQPNISLSWIDIDDKTLDRKNIEQLAQYFEDLNLPSSSCKVVGKNNIKLQGRWSLNLVDYLINNHLVDTSKIRISSVNIGQTRLFYWIKFGKGSEYLCTLTQESINILVFYLPKYCTYMREAGSGTGISIRVSRPTNINDGLQLIIDIYGFVRFSGKVDDIQTLSRGLSEAISETINSSRLKLFLKSLEYKLIK